MAKLTTSFLIMAALPSSVVGNAFLEDELVEKLATADPEELIHINLVMVDRVSPEQLEGAVEGLSKEAARAYVVSTLKDKADSSQADLRAYLDTAVSEGSADDVRYIWLGNAVGLFAKPALIQDLSLRNDIERINWDPPRFTLFESPPGNGGDPSPDISWGLTKIGAPAAWDAGYKGEGAVVAVLDTGCDYEHPDLIGQRWENGEEISGTPGVDDDGNGYTDDFYGWNFVDDNNDVHDIDPHGVLKHGTHVTGTIAGDGTMGINTGVAPLSEFMTCVITAGFPYPGYESGVWDAMDYALDNGADVINLSGGLYHYQNPDRAAWRETCRNLGIAGMLIIAAAGNDDLHGADPPPGEIATPADVPCVIAVGATDSYDVLWEYSSKGPTTWEDVDPYNDYPNLIKPDLVAPGVVITSTKAPGPPWGYGDDTGTSMAAPHVAGLAALILGDDPDLFPHQVCWKMALTAYDINPLGKDNHYGWGRIRCLPAIEFENVPPVECPAPPKPVEPPDGE
jgi:subtilisin family serine protease